MKKNNLLCIFTCFIVFLTCFFTTSCSKSSENEEKTDNTDIVLTVATSDTSTKENAEVKYTLKDLKKLDNGLFEGIYSTINNWPTKKNYAARGITIEAILKDSGFYEKAQTITVVSKDGYKQSFTRSQLLDKKQYYYVDEKETSEVKSILAYEFKEDSSSLDEVKSSNPCLIIGQTNYNEHSNPVFVEDVEKIYISFEKPEKWENAYTFPESKNVDIGEKVKLQHKDFGLVKIYYTLDGSEPTVLDNMYNPSTYQPEKNKPIIIEKDTVIKAFVSGYGKEDSDVVTFEFKVNK